MSRFEHGDIVFFSRTIDGTTHTFIGVVVPDTINNNFGKVIWYSNGQHYDDRNYNGLPNHNMIQIGHILDLQSELLEMEVVR